MRALRNLLAMAVLGVSLAAVAELATADEIAGADVYESTQFVTNTSRENANIVKADIEAGNQLPRWKGPVTVTNSGDNYTVTAQKLRIVPRNLGAKQLTAPAPNQKKIEWHTARLTPGARYVIDLKSGTGATEMRDGIRKALPGFFDPVLMVLDDQPNAKGDRPMLPGGFNDDIDWPRNCNSRVTITAPPSGVVRIVVTSYRDGESGQYTIEISGAD
jgi:hypothetical protein